MRINKKSVMLKINNKFDIGQTVYLITDPDQNKRLVTNIIVTPIGVMYGLTFGDDESIHYEIHITEEKSY